MGYDGAASALIATRSIITTDVAQFFTDKYLKYRAAIRGDPIEGDRACEHCGYNLRGLRMGGVCPECGTAIRYRRDPNVPFHEMPLPLIRSFRMSAWLATVSLGSMVVLSFSAPWLPSTPPQTLMVVLALTFLWVVGVWHLTTPLNQPQAARRGFARESRLRLAARWLQLAWLAYAATGVVSTGPGATPPGLLLVALVCWVAGMAGIFALAVLLSRLADWMQDEFAERAFHLAVYGPAIAAGLLLFFGLLGMVAGSSLVVHIGIALSLAILVISLVGFPVGLLSLSRSVSWAAVHAGERRERSLELARRRDRRDPMGRKEDQPT